MLLDSIFTAIDGNSAMFHRLIPKFNKKSDNFNLFYNLFFHISGISDVDQKKRLPDAAAFLIMECQLNFSVRGGGKPKVCSCGKSTFISPKRASYLSILSASALRSILAC
jgi:hypothetical protein